MKRKFNFWPFKQKDIRLEMKFHTAVNNHIEHGTLFASHVSMGLNNFALRFVFVNLSEAPKMSREVFNYIIDQAEKEGYIVHALRSYACVTASLKPLRSVTYQSEAERAIAEAEARVARQKLPLELAEQLDRIALAPGVHYKEPRVVAKEPA